MCFSLTITNFSLIFIHSSELLLPLGTCSISPYLCDQSDAVSREKKREFFVSLPRWKAVPAMQTWLQGIGEYTWPNPGEFNEVWEKHANFV